MQHFGKDLGIDGKSSTNSSSSSNSDAESFSSSSLSDKSEECVITTPASDRFRKRSYQSTSIQSFFVKQPKHSSSSLPHSTFEDGEEPSTRVLKQLSDPLKAKDKKRRAAREKKRRERQKSGTGRRERVVGNIIDLHAERSGADLTQAEA